MRKLAPNIVRRPFIDYQYDDALNASKTFDYANDIKLDKIGEGEFIVDKQSARPLVKVDGSMKQMVVDDNGYVFYDTPATSFEVPTTLPSAAGGGDTTIIQASGNIVVIKPFTYADVVSGSISIGTVSADSWILRTTVLVVTPFDSGGITVISAGANTLMTSDNIDLSLTSDDPMTKTNMKYLSSSTSVIATCSGTPTAGAGYIIIEVGESS